ncbi:MAG: hypothetical protein AB1847_06215 [bacterium]
MQDKIEVTRIKINDLSDDEKLKVEEMRKILGGYNTSRAWYALFGDANGNGGIFDFGEAG